MTGHDGSINVETKNNRVSEVTKLHSIQLEFTLQYITLTAYYIVKYIFRFTLQYCHFYILWTCFRCFYCHPYIK